MTKAKPTKPKDVEPKHEPTHPREDALREAERYVRETGLCLCGEALPGHRVDCRFAPWWKAEEPEPVP